MRPIALKCISFYFTRLNNETFIIGSGINKSVECLRAVTDATIWNSSVEVESAGGVRGRGREERDEGCIGENIIYFSGRWYRDMSILGIV